MSGYKRLQYSPFDLSIILVGIACIAVGVHFFNNSPLESVDFRKTETFGQISSGNGTRKLGNSLQWFDVKQNSKLFYGDVIFANESKDIEIALLDKESKLIVPEDSMIKITKAGDEFNLDVSQGSVLINTKKNKKINLRDKRGKVRKLTISKNSRVKISSKKSNVTVEAIKGKASITKKNSKKILEVKKGKVLLVGPKVSKVVNKIKIINNKAIDPVFVSQISLNEKFRNWTEVEIAKKSDFKQAKKMKVTNGRIDIKALEIGPYFIRGDKKLGYDEFELKQMSNINLKVSSLEKYYQGDEVTVSWNGRPELKYRIDVKNGEKVFSKLIQGNSYKYSLQDSGDYTFQITEQLFDRKSNISNLSIKINKDLDILGLDSIEDNATKQRKIKLKNPRKVNYLVKLTNHDNKVVFNKKMSSEEVVFNELRPGKFEVELLNIKTNKPYYKSDFVVADKLVNNRTKKKVVSDKDKLNIQFKWKRAGNFPKKPEYTLQVFDKKDGEAIFTKELTDTSFRWNPPKEGKYFWKVKSADETLLRNSDIYSVNVQRPSFGTITTPKIILKYVEDKDCYRFDIPKKKYTTTYDVFIYSSRTKVNGNWKTMYRKKLKQNNDCIQSKGEGKYFYKYRLIDKWGRKSSFSKMGEIYFPISPLDDF